MDTKASLKSKPEWIRGRDLRSRWGGMSNTAFYKKLKSGLMPRPHYLFGDKIPYWSLAEIEQFEKEKMSAAEG